MVRGQFRTVLAVLGACASAAFAQQPASQVFAVVDAREMVLSNQIPPTRTGTNRADFGIPQKLFEYGAQTPLSTGLGYTVSSYCWTAWQLRGESMMTEPSRDPSVAMRAVAPKQAGARPGIVIVINEWWKDSPGDEYVCRKALTGYVIGVGGVVLAKSSAADHSCLNTFSGKNESQQINELLASLLNTPTMSAALKGQIIAPPVSAPPPPPGVSAPPPPPPTAPVPAASSCSDAQVAKLKSYGISDDDIRRTCAGTK